MSDKVNVQLFEGWGWCPHCPAHWMKNGSMCPFQPEPTESELTELRRFKAAALTLTTEASVRFVMEKLDAKK